MPALCSAIGRCGDDVDGDVAIICSGGNGLGIFHICYSNFDSSNSNTPFNFIIIICSSNSATATCTGAITNDFDSSSSAATTSGRPIIVSICGSFVFISSSNSSISSAIDAGCPLQSCRRRRRSGRGGGGGGYS